MKLLKLLIVISATVILAGCTSLGFNQPQKQGDVTIEYTNGDYSPSEITIKKDQTITFSNNSNGLMWPASNLHPTHEIYPDFDPREPIDQGKSWSFTFERAGEWKFHDHLNPGANGTITVEE